MMTPEQFERAILAAVKLLPTATCRAVIAQLLNPKFDSREMLVGEMLALAANAKEW